ncbi:TRAP transporter substrate-binding protein [Acidaminococcus timonensis]|uniref:TRAP transporter substrate-binding protein n=1 Tax=Acidaminococcus TaxID=904 RepID=UPI0025F0EBD0|nr:TRAP transporter substrate-binding protein [Acidaminococcus timonensis]
MKRFKLLVLAMTAMISIGALTGCGGGSDKGNGGKNSAVTLKIGHVEPEDRSTHKALLDFKKNVEERSKGRLKIEIYPNGSLGGDVQLTEAVATGSLDMALPSTSVLTTYSDEFGILDMPYLFKSAQSAFAAMDGDVGKTLAEKVKAKGIDILGYTYNGPRSTTSKVKPIEKPEDLQGLKMRVMESPIFIDYYKTLGANPTPMSFTELYTGLQQGTVEAQENPPSLTFANKFYEVQKYSSIDEHVHNFLAFLINDNKFKSLSAEDQKILTEEAKKYVDEQRKMELKDNEKAIKDLETVGKLKTNILTADQKAAMRKALQPMYEKYEAKFGKALFDLCEKYNK